MEAWVAFLNQHASLGFPSKILDTNLGTKFFKKPQTVPKIPKNGRRASRLFSSFVSICCEEFRSGQKLQKGVFESAAYANFATPARTSSQPNILQINAST